MCKSGCNVETLYKLLVCFGSTMQMILDYSVIVVYFFLGNSQPSEFYMQTFWNTLSVPKHRHIKFRCQGITQKKAYNIQNMAKV